MNNHYNKELILVHQFLQKNYNKFKASEKMKSNQDRLEYAHAIKIVGDIAYNCNITDKKTPHETRNPEFYNTVYDD